MTFAISDETLLSGMIDLALAAGANALAVYARTIHVARKSDDSPVTEADQQGETIILEGLERLAPSIPTLAEEAAAAGHIPALGEEFFVVDPLDGTKEFVDRTGEFTVNIALVRNRRPAIGVVYAPALSKLYAGRVGAGAFSMLVDKVGQPDQRLPIAARRVGPAGLTAVASRSHATPETEAFLAALPVASYAAAGSSLKFCLIAEGLADVYPRMGRTMEWDTAAGQAVLEAAGGRVDVHPAGGPLSYGKIERGFDNPHFVAWGAR